MEDPDNEEALSGSPTDRLLLSQTDLASSTTVLDLPQLYQKPSAAALLEALDLLRVAPPDFGGDGGGGGTGRVSDHGPQRRSGVHPDGVPKYLTSMVGSRLSWIDDEGSREAVWAEASARLSERSGRTAMPSISRAFTVPTGNQSISVTLHEPSLTGDHLGLKTWASSMLLARRLESLRHHLPPRAPLRVLELGAGTGLVGLAAAHVWSSRPGAAVVSVTLTDLPAILPNLARNVASNAPGGDAAACTAAVLDWSDPAAFALPLHDGDDDKERARFPVVVAADPLYSPDHPRLLVQTVDRWLSLPDSSSSSSSSTRSTTTTATEGAAKFIVELPLREAYAAEVADFKTRMSGAGFVCVDEGEETGYDDWQSREGGRVEVRCWWGVWMRERAGKMVSEVG